MPYLGNNPTANFATVTKDTFSGNASTTAFTLSKPATTNGVAVYVENVRQIPTTAYAVSGTTLTFTGAPPSGTNNIYVMHHNTPVSTATHPAAQDLTAVNGTFTGDITINDGTAADKKILFDGNAQDYHVGLDDSADSLIIGKGSALGTTTHLSINENGFLREPEIPASQNSKNVNSQAQTISGTTNYVITSLNSSYYNSHSVNNKSYFDTSNSKFTVPSGEPTAHYFCFLHVLVGITRPSSGVNWMFLGIRKNGDNTNGVPFQAYREATNGMGTSTYVYDSNVVGGVIKLEATDYLEPIFSGSDGVAINIHSGNYTSFSVIKIG